ncbi:hypothetical protein HBB16_10865 [Pseudonocardia sp. MCCB 268]|nr:hypothetical protein [Pseudonocardia cytotoxica]
MPAPASCSTPGTRPASATLDVARSYGRAEEFSPAGWLTTRRPTTSRSGLAGYRYVGRLADGRRAATRVSWDHSAGGVHRAVRRPASSSATARDLPRALGDREYRVLDDGGGAPRAGPASGTAVSGSGLHLRPGVPGGGPARLDVRVD